MTADDSDIEEDLRRLAEPGEDCDATTAFAELRSEIERLRHREVPLSARRA